MCLINFLRQSRSNGKGRSDWKGFSTTIKRQASQPGSVVSRKDGGLIIFTAIFIVMWMAVNALVWGVNCGTQSMALRNCAGRGIPPRVLQEVGCPPDAHHQAGIRHKITPDSHSLLPVITNNSRAVCWLPDKRIRPSSASWRSGHHPEAIDGAAQWWKATCQRRVYDINFQALPHWILFYFIRFIFLSPFSKKKK